MSAIRSVNSREVLDSRGNPTVEVDVRLNGDPGIVGHAMVPSGASTGQSEAHELRDGDANRYDGKGVLRAVANVSDVLGPAVIGMNPRQQAEIDQLMIELDGTPNKARLGANAILGVSLAVAHAAARAERLPLYQHIHSLYEQTAPSPDVIHPMRLPSPVTNMISGGLHAGGNLDIQDVLIEPVGAHDYATCLQWLVRVYRRLGQLLTDAGFEGRLVGDEGGYGPRLQSNKQALEFVVEAIHAARLAPGKDVTLALDVAATQFQQKDGLYVLASERNKTLTSAKVVSLLESWCDQFPISSIEDGLGEEDWPAWQALYNRLGDRVKLVGDDLFVTSADRVRKGHRLKVANCVLIKLNQVGSLTETLHTIHAARAAGFSIVVSARSGETEDTTIADLAVGTGAEQIKIGSIARSERLAKYHRLIRIADQLGSGPVK